MSPDSNDNAIGRRIVRMRDLWNEFIENEGARLLRWLAAEDELRMVEAFLQIEQEEEGEVPALFLRFPQVFDESAAYCETLVECLREQYGESRKDLESQGVATDWEAPETGLGESGTAAFARACMSFQEHHSDLVETLAVVLEPETVAATEAWQDLLGELATADLPPSVRFLVIDSAEAPALDELSESLAGRLVTHRLALEMANASEDLARQYGDTGPTGRFRNYLVELTNAGARRDLDRAGTSADAALAIAREQGWADQEVAVLLCLGAIVLGAGKPDEAVKSYRKAADVAEAGRERGDETAGKLLLQARFAEGSALFSSKRYAEAAGSYEAAASLVGEDDAKELRVEGWRMAAHCLVLARKNDEAWKSGLKAIEAGAQLDDEARAASTLPYAGQEMLRLAEGRTNEDIETIETRMIELLGEDWEKATQEAAPPT